MSIARPAWLALFLCGCGTGEPNVSDVEPFAPARFTYESTEFPGDAWEVTEAAGAGWDPAELEAIADLAEGAWSTGLCVVYQGRLLLDRQWKPDDSALPDAEREAFRWTFRGQHPSGRYLQDVTSIQKSVVSLLLAGARERGELRYDERLLEVVDPEGLRVPPGQAEGVTLFQLMTMTSNVSGEVHGPGSRWAYDPLAPQLLLDVLQRRAAGGIDGVLADFARSLGASSLGWTSYPEYPTLVGLAATDLDLARIGLLVQEGGRWGEVQLLPEAAVAELIRPSQALNPNYGMLWMLNRPGAVLPGGERLEGRPLPHAPEDLAIAQGRSDCALMISPSEQLVVVRLGARVPGRGGALGAGMDFWDELWRRLMEARPCE